MSKSCMLSTIDNPFNPFEDFDAWYQYDTVENNYNTCGVLAREAHISDQFTEDEVSEEIERAIDEIIKHDYEDKYIKVKEDDVSTSKNTPMG